MAVPSDLVQSYHAITCNGQSLLTTDGHDFFPLGEEPRVRRSQAKDTPDCAGRAHGELYGRGNTRWEASITRVRCFLDFEYPVTDEDFDFTADSAQEYAQKWLMRHLTAISDATSTLAWTSIETTWGSAVLDADGTTDGGFAVVTYSITMSEASS